MGRLHEAVLRASSRANGAWAHLLHCSMPGRHWAGGHPSPPQSVAGGPELTRDPKAHSAASQRRVYLKPAQCSLGDHGPRSTCPAPQPTPRLLRPKPGAPCPPPLRPWLQAPTSPEHPFSPFRCEVVTEKVLCITHGAQSCCHHKPFPRTGLGWGMTSVSGLRGATSRTRGCQGEKLAP